MSNSPTTQPLYIGYVLKRYPRFSETFVVNEILAHERAGMKADIFALGPVSETHFQDGISQVRAPVTRLDDKQRNTESLWRLLDVAYKTLPDFATKMTEMRHADVHEFAQAIQLALAICERGIQHLHAHFGTRATTVARLAARLSDIGYSFTAHAKDIYYPYKESTGLNLKLRDAAQTVTVSDYNLSYLKEQYGADADKTVRIYNGIDLRKFPYLSPEKRERHILAVGRLVPKKGFSELVDAVQILKQRGVNFHCTLIGDGALRDTLNEKIQQADVVDCMTLTGQQPQPDIIAAMQSAAMVVAPCVVSEEGDRDGLPTVLLESMALGTPVISTRVAGIPELVMDNETGLCVEPHAPQALADAMQRLLDDVPARLRLSQEARRLIEREYDIDRNTALLRAIFQRAIA